MQVFMKHYDTFFPVKIVITKKRIIFSFYIIFLIIGSLLTFYIPNLLSKGISGIQVSIKNNFFDTTSLYVLCFPLLELIIGITNLISLLLTHSIRHVGIDIMLNKNAELDKDQFEFFSNVIQKTSKSVGRTFRAFSGCIFLISGIVSLYISFTELSTYISIGILFASIYVFFILKIQTKLGNKYDEKYKQLVKNITLNESPKFNAQKLYFFELLNNSIKFLSFPFFLFIIMLMVLFFIIHFMNIENFLTTNFISLSAILLIVYRRSVEFSSNLGGIAFSKSAISRFLLSYRKTL